MKAGQKRNFSVTGPDTDKGFVDHGPAVSCAQTRASRHKGEATFYVRDALDDVVSRVEKHADGRVFVYGVKPVRR